MRTPKVGQYEYDRRGNGFRIYRVESVSSNGNYVSAATNEFFTNREDARNYVWKMNGWGTPKNRLN